jgi:hypothetical protein
MDKGQSAGDADDSSFGIFNSEGNPLIGVSLLQKLYRRRAMSLYLAFISAVAMGNRSGMPAGIILLHDKDEHFRRPSTEALTQAGSC